MSDQLLCFAPHPPHRLKNFKERKRGRRGSWWEREPAAFPICCFGRDEFLASLPPKGVDFLPRLVIKAEPSQFQTFKQWELRGGAARVSVTKPSRFQPVALLPLPTPLETRTKAGSEKGRAEPPASPVSRHQVPQPCGELPSITPAPRHGLRGVREEEEKQGVQALWRRDGVWRSSF